ncbi:MAG TPA: thioredoxin domain-containing protein [Gemmatimonadales bacterium]|nr:thioredoxin domain-containing protein [Gemmatimonadales bacterium]
MRSHRHLDEVGPLTVARSPTRFARIAILVPGILLGAVVAYPRTPQHPDALAARSKGPATAPVTVYEMADFQCPACRGFTIGIMPTLDKQFIQTGKVRWVFINLPLVSIHPNAMAAAEVAMCAARQGRFWQTHDALYLLQDDWAKLEQPRAKLLALAERAGANRAKLVACVDSGTVRTEVEQDAQRAMRSGANATPSFYIEGGLIQGAPPTPDPMVKILDSIYTARIRANK